MNEPKHPNFSEEPLQEPQKAPLEEPTREPVAEQPATSAEVASEPHLGVKAPVDTQDVEAEALAGPAPQFLRSDNADEMPLEVNTEVNRDADGDAASVTPPHQGLTSTPAPVSRRFGPLFAAISLSVVWVGLVIAGAVSGELPLGDSFFSSLQTLALLSAPLALFWLVALAFQRSDPLLERRLATAQTLHKAIAPVEQAESRLAAINKKLTQDLANIEAMTTIADDRLGHLEQRFNSQVDRLFSASSDAEARALAIRESMGQERDAFDDLSDKLSTRLDRLEQTIAAVTASLDAAGGRVSDTTGDVESRLVAGITRMDGATETLSSKMGSVMGVLDKSTNAFEDSATDVELRLNSVTDTLLRGMSGFKTDVEGLENRSHELSEHMSTQGQVLADLAALAAAESDKIQTTLKTHVDQVRSSAKSALEETETVSKQVSERATELSAHISSTLNRAEGSVDATAAIFQGRIETALKSADDMLSGLEVRAGDASDKVKADIQSAEAELNRSAEQAVERIHEAQTLFRTEGVALVEEASATAVRSLSQLRQMRANVEAELAALEAASSKVAAAMAEQGDTLASEAKQTLEDLGKASDATASRIEDRLQAFTEASQKELAAVAEQGAQTVDDIEASIRDLRDASEAELEALAKATGKSESAIEDQLKALRQASDDELAALAKALAEGAGKVGEQISELGAASARELGALVTASDGAKDSILDQMANLAHRADTEFARFEQAGNAASDSLVKNAHSLVAEADALTQAAAAADSKVGSTGTRFLKAADDIRSQLEVTREELLSVEESMAEKQQSLLNSADAASTHLKEASSVFLAQAGQLSDASKSSVTEMDHASKRLLGSLDDSVIRVEEKVLAFKRLNDDLGDQLETSSAQVTKATHSTRAELAQTRDAISDATKKLTEERDGLVSDSEAIVSRLKDASSAVGDEVSRFAEKSDDAAVSLRDAAQMVITEAAEADRVMQRAVADTKTELSAGLDNIAEGASVRVNTLREELQNTLERLLEDYEDGATRAQKESAHLIMRLGTEADRITGLADKFADKAANFEKTVKETNSVDFSKDSKVLLENLSEASVDINRALSSDITDKDWQAYLDGDRNRFARRTVTAGDRKTRKLVAERFKTDREFRETCARFMRAFESMMERAMTGEKSDSLSVTLISSDMGKLYVLLAQSLKRLG